MLRIHSLKNRLTLGVCLIVLVAGLATGWDAYDDTREQVEELFDAEMAQMARILRSIFSWRPLTAEDAEQLVYSDFNALFDLPERYSEHAFETGEISSNEPGHYYEKKLAFQIYDRDGQLLLQNRSAEELSLPLRPVGFSDYVDDQHLWRVFVLEDPQLGQKIQVAQRDDVRNELTLEIAIHAVVGPLAIMPLVAGLLWWLIHHGFRPVERLSGAVAHRAPMDARPLERLNNPSEVWPLIDAMNGLFERVLRHAQRERQFTADAAHELRTPLAALKIHLQNAVRRASDARTRESLEKALASLDGLIQLTEQLLLLNRLEADALIDERLPQSLQEVLHKVIEGLKPLMAEKNLTLDLHVSADWPAIKALPGHLHSLLQNLIGNAVKFADTGSRLEINMDRSSLRIVDEGPGIPENEITRVYERFYRVGGDQSPGSGLGLSIVSRLAKAYGIRLTLKNRNDGKTGVTVILSQNSQNP